jgi:uncharacterized protein (DUF3820 family)
VAKLGFGKYADLELSMVPEEYLSWLIHNSREGLKKYEGELLRWQMAEDADMSWVERIVKTGFNELAKRHHPDRGGSGRDMVELNAAYERLKQTINEEVAE